MHYNPSNNGNGSDDKEYVMRTVKNGKDMGTPSVLKIEKNIPIPPIRVGGRSCKNQSPMRFLLEQLNVGDSVYITGENVNPMHSALQMRHAYNRRNPSEVKKFATRTDPADHKQTGPRPFRVWRVA